MAAHMRTESVVDWNHWFYLHSSDNPRPLKSEIAEKLSLSPAEFSKRLNPKRYNPPVSDTEVALTAAMWNQSPEYVRSIFPRGVIRNIPHQTAQAQTPKEVR